MFWEKDSKRIGGIRFQKTFLHMNHVIILMMLTALLNSGCSNSNNKVMATPSTSKNEKSRKA